MIVRRAALVEKHQEPPRYRQRDEYPPMLKVGQDYGEDDPLNIYDSERVDEVVSTTTVQTT